MSDLSGRDASRAKASELMAAAGERCPRCGDGFHCSANEPAPCACTGVHLSSALLAELRERYAGCLCLRCLAELGAADGARDEAS